MFKNGLYTHFYRPQTKLPEDNVSTPVCDSVHGRGGVHPQGRHPPPRWALKWAVRILLECIVVLSVIPICPIEKNRNLVINRTYEWTITSRYQEAKGPQWQVQDFHKVGVATLGGEGACYQHTILPKFPKNCIKLKEFGPWGCASKIILQTNSCATEKIPGMTERTVSKDFLPEAENSLVLLIALLS